MIDRNSDQRQSTYDEDFAGIPTDGFWAKWFWGLFAPLLLASYGVMCCITRQGTLPGDRSGVSMELHGEKAFALGIASASIGLFLHCHYFWGNIYHLSFWATLGKIISALAFIGSLGYLIARIGIFG